MKFIPAKPVARSQHIRTGLSITLGVLTLAILWFANGSLPQYAMAAALTTTATVPPTETPTTVSTVPPTETPTTVSTVPPTETPTTVSTVPPTETPTETPTKTPTKTPSKTPTKTPTKTPLPPGTDGVLELVPDFPKTGDYCMASGGAGLTFDSSDSFPMNVNGTPIAAYLLWSARYPESAAGDPQIEVKINGGTGIMVSAAQLREAPSGWTNYNHHTYYSSDLLTDPNFAGRLSGTFEVTISSLTSAGLEEDQGHGASLLVFYENTNDCPDTEVNFFFGLDGFHHNFPPPYGPNSEVVCVDVPVSAEDRLLKVKFFVGGAEGTRPNAIWYYTSTGNHPTDLIDNQLGTILAGQPLTDGPALTANAGPQWDDYTNMITVPAEAAFACFQIESIDVIPSVTMERGTSGVWVGLATELLPGAGGSPPTATPTGTQPTATPTATPTTTPTDTQPTVTPTATPTTIQPTATPTITPTGTPPTATPTATATTVPAPKFSLEITFEPNPPVPGQPLIFTIHIKNTGNVILRTVKLIVLVPNDTSYQVASALRSAGWQCNGTDAGDTCEYTVGDMGINVGDDIPYGVQVDRTITSGTEIVLNVRAVTADGLSLNGNSGTDSQAVVEQTIMLLPWVTTP